MLRKIRISNFFSIKEPQEINFVVAKNAPNIPDRFSTPISDSNDRFPRVVAIFGPNASGKSTVLRAISFVKWFVEHSFDEEVDETIPFIPFHDENSFNGITEMSFELDGQIFNEDTRCIYQYNIKFQNSNTKKSYIIHESLFYAPKGKFRRIFERDNGNLLFGDDFQIRKNDPRTEIVRPNASLISTFAKFGHPMSMWIIAGLEGIRARGSFFKNDLSESEVLKYYNDNRDVLTQFNKQIQTIDLGIKEFKIGGLDKTPIAFFTHAGLNTPLPLFLESQGTRNFFNLFPDLNYVLNVGGVAVLDDFDNDIHSLLLPEIVRWFYDPNKNKHNAQLIMSCHNATLLEVLEKEEVYFTEKNNKGETEIYGLKDIDKVRRDTNIYKKYLGGAFGAVPHIG